MSEFLEGHTVKRYDGELNNLHLLVLEMGGLALDQCRRALEAFRDADLELLTEVIRRESEVDALELRVDREIWWEIGRRGPVARDLRAIMTFSKVVTDLERVGDEAARIAQIGLELYSGDASRPSSNLMRDVRTMGALALSMLEEGVALLDVFEVDRAAALIARDSELDEEFQSCLRRMSTFILEDARTVGHAIDVVVLLKSLERVGDHSRNLAEYVIYLVRGEDVRHPGARRGTPDED